MRNRAWRDGDRQRFADGDVLRSATQSSRTTRTKQIATWKQAMIDELDEADWDGER